MSKPETAMESIELFRDLVDSPVVDVGYDPDYRPDSPRLRRQFDD